MLSTRSLPPQFLLPAWSAQQLTQAFQSRTYISDSSGTTKKQRRASTVDWPLFEQLRNLRAAKRSTLHHSQVETIRHRRVYPVEKSEGPDDREAIPPPAKLVPRHNSSPLVFRKHVTVRGSRTDRALAFRPRLPFKSRTPKEVHSEKERSISPAGEASIEQKGNPIPSENRAISSSTNFAFRRIRPADQAQATEVEVHSTSRGSKKNRALSFKQKVPTDVHNVKERSVPPAGEISRAQKERSIPSENKAISSSTRSTARRTSPADQAQAAEVEINSIRKNARNFEIPDQQKPPQVEAKAKFFVKESAKRPVPQEPPRSLFEELFPDEPENKRIAAEERPKKLPAFIEAEPNVSQTGTDLWHQKLFSAALDNRDSDSLTTPVDSQVTWQNNMMAQPSTREPTVLILTAASRILEQSDFYRLSPQGQHIEGWTSGIKKVIPARDSQTLETLGHYFILFYNEASARTYLSYVHRLHQLSSSHPTTGGFMVSPPDGMIKEGEDLSGALRNFSLIPPSNKLGLRMVRRPHRPGVARIVRDGNDVAMIGRQGKAEDMVLFSLNRDQIAYNDLKQALNDDGKERNLHWKLAGEGETIRSVDGFDEVLSTSGHGSNRPHGFSRYIIAFKDRHEARRFVREWHRREIPFRTLDHTGDEPPPIVNAEILW